MAVSCTHKSQIGTMRRTRILFAAVDIGDRIRTYSAFIRENYGNNAKVRSFVKFKVPGEHYKTSYDYTFQFYKYPKPVQWCISMVFFIYSLLAFDVIYIFSAENILTRKLLRFELKVYQLFGKKVVMHFVGGDVRNSDYLYWKNQALVNATNEPEPMLQSKFQEQVCRLAEAYADHIIVCSPDLFKFFRRKDVRYIPVFLDVNIFTNELNNANDESKAPGKVTILHAPSNPGVKGTRYIEKVLTEIGLADKNIEVVLTTGKQYSDSVHPPYTVTRYKLMELLKRSDIVIDQLLIGWYGLQSVEALAAGNVTICQVDESLENYVFPGCPILTFKNAAELKTTILEAIEKVKDDHMDKSSYMKWIEKYHSIENNGEIKSLFDELITGA